MICEVLIELFKFLVEFGKLFDDVVFLDVYGKDWIKYFVFVLLVIVFFKSVEQVQVIVCWVNQYKVGLVLLGGCIGFFVVVVVVNGEVVVVFDYMNWIFDFNVFDCIVVCQLGVVIK